MEKTTRIGIVYDFDKTLGIDDMQTFGLIQDLGYQDPNVFWKKCNDTAVKENMDSTLAFMYTLLDTAKRKGIKLTRDFLRSYGKNVKYYPGLKKSEYFNRINKFAEENDVELNHYVVSSGNQEIIEGTEIYHNFKKVFGCEYLYNSDNVAIFPKLAINYTNKTQFLFRITKNAFDLADTSKVNASVQEDKKYIPFHNIIYIADGTTDIPCMKLVSEKGGTSIAVYHDKTDNDQAKEIFNKGRADFITKADYSDGKELDILLKHIIQKIKHLDWLTKRHLSQKAKYSIVEEDKDQI